MAGADGSGGTGVLERTGLDNARDTEAPRTDSGGESGSTDRKNGTGGGDVYRVLLLDDDRHTEPTVTQVLPNVVPGVSFYDAQRCYRQSKDFGSGVITTCVKEHAEMYKTMLFRHGLRTSTEPDGTTL